MNNNFHPVNVSTCITVLTIVCLSFVAGCAGNNRFEKSSVVPAAEGKVKIKKDRNNNYEINVSIIRLADPERLQPPKQTYVVWMETKDNGTRNLGKLTSSSGLLSKTLKASLHTVTSFKPRRIFITAEKNGTIEEPGSLQVLTTNKLK